MSLVFSIVYLLNSLKYVLSFEYLEKKIFFEPALKRDIDAKGGPLST